MKISLPDVNVLLALAAEGHVHHVSARKWFSARGDDSVAICRVTQMGLLRLLTNPKAMASGARSIGRAWDASNELLADKRVLFEYESPGLDDAWAELMRHPTVGPSSWTDAYLAAFARQYGYEMVTFDLGFQRWPGLSLNLLAG